ncbi:MFS transporter [Streptomyces hoynatensis]|uniref:MFS transporter n=1 Tax=Streptomyces hoynatensis TaxID=1141874 RepID=A0A3A9YN78_9ACTN|nr:MFS transporter [Streptomyces hoynatensis]RKN36056.1 MFS transporter [Streptomyces hoynatensis]
MTSDLRVLLRLSGFRRLMGVRLLSQFADGLFQAGLAAYVVFSPEEQTSSADIAAAMAVLLLPYSLLGPFAGVLLDRLRRRQVLLHGSLLRGGMAGVTSALVLAGTPHWMFYLCALLVTAVNRFVLAALSASLPRVVDADRLLMANALSPTAGTLAATTGAGTAFVAQFVAGSQGGRDATALLLAALVYVLAGLAALSMNRSLLGPPEGAPTPRLGTALADTARGLAAGLRHLGARPRASWTLGALAVTRFCYGALFVTLLMLARFSWTDGGEEDGMALLGLAVAVSGAGFFVAALLTPAAAARLGALRWFSACALLAAVLVPVLGLGFRVVPGLIAAFVLGLVSQGTKIVTDTVLQSSIDDAFRGRVFSLYDMLFNIAFVAAAGLAALVLPHDGRSAALVIAVAALYAATAVTAHRLHAGAVSRETETAPGLSPERPTTP